MAYRTLKRGRRSYTRRVTRKRFGGTRRRSYPTTRRRYTKRRGMSRRKIVDITSTKKKDNMQCFTNIRAGQDTDGGTLFASDVPTLEGGRMYIMPWIATARRAEGAAPLQASRTKTEVYWRGVKERVQIQTNNGTPWQWRRICFTAKRSDLRNRSTGSFGWAITGPVNLGWMRAVNDVAFSAPDIANSMLDLMFDGNQGVDWSNYFTAKVDPESVTVKYDRTIIINPGNDSGVMKNYSMWHGMNKNLQYDDDENGNTMNFSPFSTAGKRGMGDYYIVDFIESGSGGNADDRLSFHPQATAYWHEK
uniref:Capsid protein n=1 Tax=Genomoviridae sp. TaxID=2202565 RepID=A0A858NFY8_9VIRU|nr:MAG: capsid protein [Genomoviridae sp.]